MLLLHQAGSVKIGEVVRYTLTYTPSNDRILPTPSHLHLKIKNSSAIPLRAAWVHGPYTLHVAAYPSTFNPHCKVDDVEKEGAPEYEPMLKAGGSWTCKLLVPEAIRETGADVGKQRRSVDPEAGQQENCSVTWIIEVTSQILFSNSASVHFEVLVGRDERALELGFAAIAGHGHGEPGRVKEQHGDRDRKEARRRGNVQNDGVYSKAVKLVAEDTETLWDKPPLPTYDEEPKSRRKSTDVRKASVDVQNKKPRKKRNVHLVIVTHGLHSNLGADMLFLKESIDATVKQARVDAKKRKENYRAQQTEKSCSKPADGTLEDSEPPKKESETSTATAPLSGGQEDLDADEDDEEDTIVRGFSGNAVRTENGIQYLGKRLAKYILRLTYPDQPFLPIKKSFSRTLTDPFKSEAEKAKRDGKSAHNHSSIHQERARKAEELAYHFTSISFIGHSLGGLIQTYAIAYIHKHAPEFFAQIKPINFICMASPMLGLSNENPMYVRFALDFGLVGRSGQDLGLTWRPPTMVRSGWNSMFGGNSSNKQDGNEAGKEDPAAKPLLRILPTGPAHQVLRLFRNRTVYSNVVNDGIVPLRTSCLLFLDWRGLGKVEKARRENGLIGTMAEWGWAELTGANASTIAPNVLAERFADSEDEEVDPGDKGQGEQVPLPDENEVALDNRLSSSRLSHHGGSNPPGSRGESSPSAHSKDSHNEKGMLDQLISFFRPNTPNHDKKPHTSKKTNKALRRGQTIHHDYDDASEESASGQEGTTSNPTMRPHMPHLHTGQVKVKRPKASRGDSLVNVETGELQAPPKTSIFESAGDILHPPLPSRQWITDPSTRSRTIFHDKVYHPEDIPPPPIKRPGSRIARSFSSDKGVKPGESPKAGSVTDQESVTSNSPAPPESGGMKVEEKIARAYHRDVSWRKVLVRLEPDAHNNMIVRRMFANAYGWPVIKHLCDTHFADTYTARTRDEEEPARERAPPMEAPIDSTTGEEVMEQTTKTAPKRSESEMREARDELHDLDATRRRAEGSYSSKLSGARPSGGLHRMDSVEWDDSFFEGSDGEDSDAVDERNLVSRLINPNLPIKKPQPAHHRPTSSHDSSVLSSSTPRSPSFVDGHRGLAPVTPVKERMSRDSTSPTFDSGDIDPPLMVAEPAHVVDEPAPMSPGTGGVAEGLGLKKSVEEQVANVAVGDGK